MPYVVTDLCNGCRYTECVSVCPVECFHIDDTMTYEKTRDLVVTMGQRN